MSGEQIADAIEQQIETQKADGLTVDRVRIDESTYSWLFNEPYPHHVPAMGLSFYGHVLEVTDSVSGWEVLTYG